MADYFTEFSVVVPTKCVKQRDFFLKKLEEHVNVTEGCCTDEIFQSVQKHEYTEGIWVHSRHGGMGSLARAVQDWQKRYKYLDPFKLTWASYSTVGSPGTFGGGALLVYRGKVMHVDAHSIMDQWIHREDKLELDAVDADWNFK